MVFVVTENSVNFFDTEPLFQLKKKEVFSEEKLAFAPGNMYKIRCFDSASLMAETIDMVLPYPRSFCPEGSSRGSHLP